MAEMGRECLSPPPDPSHADSMTFYPPPRPRDQEATMLHKIHEQVSIKHHPAIEKQKKADATCSHTSWDLEARLDSLFTAFWRKMELSQQQ
ncbi:Hypothetical predicted protein, partial [Pelobates cultripes]